MGYDADIPQSNDIWQNRVTHWMPFPQPPKEE
jgi:phage terminase large subunit-like protein